MNLLLCLFWFAFSGLFLLVQVLAIDGIDFMPPHLPNKSPTRKRVDMFGLITSLASALALRVRFGSLIGALRAYKRSDFAQGFGASKSNYRANR